MENIFKQFDSIVAAYDLKTAKNLTRIQKGLQPKDGFENISDEIHTADLVLRKKKDENDPTYDEVSRINDHFRGRPEAPINLNQDETLYTVKKLYKKLLQEEPNIEIEEQFNYQYFLKQLRDAMKKIERYQDMRDKHYEKISKRAQELEKKFYMKKYNVPDEHSAKTIITVNVANNEYAKAFKEGKACDFNRFADPIIRRIIYENKKELEKIYENDPVLKKLNEKTENWYSQQDKKIQLLINKTNQYIINDMTGVSIQPKFELRNVYNLYDDLFEKITGKSNARRMVPKELVFSKDEFIKRLNNQIHKPADYICHETECIADRKGDIAVVISRAAYDIAGIDTNRRWITEESDYFYNKNLNNGKYSEDIPLYIQKGYLIAYLCDTNDTTSIEDSKNNKRKNSKINIQNPLGAILIKGYVPETNNIKHKHNYEKPNWILAVSKIGRGMIPLFLRNEIQAFLDKYYNDEKIKENDYSEFEQFTVDGKFDNSDGDAFYYR